MNDKTCFFIGHREAPENLLEPLIAAVERHVVEYGVGEFTVGRYGNFDTLAAQAVREVKKRYPEIVLTLLTPYYDPEKPEPLPEGFDGSFYPPGMEGVPKRYAIVRANRYLVQHSDFLIAYARHPASNSRELVKYARSREKKGLIRVENLGEE